MPERPRLARAVEVWAALKSLGRSGLAELLGRNCRQARRKADALMAGGAEVLNEVVLNQVIVAFGADARTERVIAAVQEADVFWCGGTRCRGRAAMRNKRSTWSDQSAH